MRLTRPVSGVFALSLLVAVVTTAGAGLMASEARAEQYHSRLNSLLIRKSMVYLPTRLTLGKEVSFVVKAQAGSTVQLYLSPKSDGLVLPNGTPMRVGSDAQVLTGIVPENGVLELKLEMPNQPELDQKVLYFDAAAGDSEETLRPIDLMDPTGRRTDENALVIMKPAEMGAPMVMPNLPGLSPQMMNQLTTMTDVYSSGDSERKKLLDNGNINPDRAIDRNPFIQRGSQTGYWWLQIIRAAGHFSPSATE